MASEHLANEGLPGLFEVAKNSAVIQTGENRRQPQHSRRRNVANECIVYCSCTSSR